MTPQSAIQRLSDAFARECFLDIDLPSSTALFVAGGVPNVLACFRRQDWCGDLYEWLYIPESSRVKLASELTVFDAASSQFLTDPISIDHGNLYVFGADGQIQAALLHEGSGGCPLSNVSAGAMREALSSYTRGMQATQFNMATQFVRRLFHRDQSLTEFFEGFMSLLCEQWPHSLSGIYYRTGETYRLRFVSGSLKFTDKLQGQVDSTTAKVWKEIVATESFYTPIDLLPEEPTLLPTPPSFLVLVEGPKSPRTEYVTATIVSGDIDRAAAENMIHVATLASELDETQFASVTEINTLFGHLSSSLPSGIDMISALKAIYGVLVRQLDVRSLLLSDGAGQAWQVTGRADERPHVEVIDGRELPEPSGSQNSSQGIRIVEHETPHGTNEKSKGIGIVSRADIDIKNIAGSTGLLEIGSCLPKAALDTGRETMRASAEYLQLCLALSKVFADGRVVVNKADHTSNMNFNNLKVMQQIADGHFHEILGDLSMVLGQSELIARDSAPGAVAISEDQFFACAHKISNAVDRITHKIETLREVTLLSAGNSRKVISAREFMMKLPTIVDGYGRQLRDTKNIRIGIDVDPSGRIDFELTQEDVSGTILPVILELMSQAAINGTVRLCLTGGPEARRLSMTFARQLITHTTLEKLIEQSLLTARLDRQNDFNGIAQVGSLQIRYRQISSDSLEIDYSVCNSADDHPDLKHRSSSSRKPNG